MLAISIIIPVYNVEKYIKTAVDSILKQSLHGYEIILVDDGSTDQSGKICDEIAKIHPTIQVYHQKNMGAAVARNTGLSAARGKYVLFLDSDDYYPEEGVLQVLYSQISELQVDVLCFNYYRGSSTGEKHFGPMIGYQPPKEYELDQYAILKNNVYQSSACTKIINREYLEKNNILFEPGLLCEDVEFCSRLLQYGGTVAYIPFVGYVYRVRQGSQTMGVSTAHVEALIGIIEKNTEIATRQNNSDLLWGYLAFQYATLLINWRLAGSACGKVQLEKLYKLSYLLDYSPYRILGIIRYFYRIFGIKLTSYFLLIHHKITTRRRV